MSDRIVTLVIRAINKTNSAQIEIEIPITEQLSRHPKELKAKIDQWKKATEHKVIDWIVRDTEE